MNESTPPIGDETDVAASLDKRVSAETVRHFLGWSHTTVMFHPLYRHADATFPRGWFERMIGHGKHDAASASRRRLR